MELFHKKYSNIGICTWMEVIFYVSTLFLKFSIFQKKILIKEYEDEIYN